MTGPIIWAILPVELMDKFGKCGRKGRGKQSQIKTQMDPKTGRIFEDS